MHKDFTLTGVLIYHLYYHCNTIWQKNVFLFAISDLQIFRASKCEHLSLQFAKEGRYLIPLDENHINQSTTANPNKPEAYVNKCLTPEDSYLSRKRADFPLLSIKCKHKSALNE